MDGSQLVNIPGQRNQAKIKPNTSTQVQVPTTKEPFISPREDVMIDEGMPDENPDESTAEMEVFIKILLILALCY